MSEQNQQKPDLDESALITDWAPEHRKLGPILEWGMEVDTQDPGKSTARASSV